MLDLRPADAGDEEGVGAAPTIETAVPAPASPGPATGHDAVPPSPPVTAFDFVAERTVPSIDAIDTMFGIAPNAAHPDTFDTGAFHPGGLHAEDHAAADAADDHPWLGRLVKRAAVALVVMLFGSAATLAWRIHGDDARQIAAAWAPGLAAAWLPATAAAPSAPPAVQAAEPAPTPQSASQRSGAQQPAPPAQATADAALLPAPDGVLQTMARDLDKARQAIEQLRSNQDELARQVARLTEQEARHRPPPPRQALAAIRKPAPAAAPSAAAQPRAASATPAVVPTTVQPRPLSLPRPPAALP